MCVELMRPRSDRIAYYERSTHNEEDEEVDERLP